MWIWERLQNQIFIISRLPKDEEEEKLEEHMWVMFGVKSFEVDACVLKDGRSVLGASKCPKCGSQEVMFDL